MLNFLNIFRLIRLMKIDPKRGRFSIKGKRMVMVPATVISESMDGISRIAVKGGTASMLYIGSKNESRSIVDIITRVYGDEVMDTGGLKRH